MASIVRVSTRHAKGKSWRLSSWAQRDKSTRIARSKSYPARKHHPKVVLTEQEKLAAYLLSEYNRFENLFRKTEYYRTNLSTAPLVSLHEDLFNEVSSGKVTPGLESHVNTSLAIPQERPTETTNAETTLESTSVQASEMLGRAQPLSGS